MVRTQELDIQLMTHFGLKLMPKVNPFLYVILIGHKGLTQITGTD
jgi:hypothetical protein